MIRPAALSGIAHARAYTFYVARLRHIALSSVVGALLFVAPGTALAQNCVAPPGTAGIDQYCETVPSAGGDQGAGPGQSRSAAPVSGKTVSALERSGQDGQALNRFLGQDPSSSAGKRSGKPSAGKQGTALDGRTADEPSSNPLAAVRSAVGSGDTVGSGFVWIMLAITLLIASVAWLRYRRGPSS